MPAITPISLSPIVGCRQAGKHIPPPPYAVFSADGINVLASIIGLNYQQGSGPSPDSASFSLLGLGLSPSAGNITITPDVNFATNFEIYNPNTSSYTSSLFTIAYTGGAETLPGFKVRLKAGLSPTSYSGTLTSTAPNTIPFVLMISGSVSAAQFIQATGGVVTTDGDYKVHTFLGDDNFVVTKVGSSPFDEVTYLIVAGGGGAGNFYGGGGGGGGVLNSTDVVSIQSYPIVVGAGGAGGAGLGQQKGFNGSDSSFDGIIAFGGGGGGSSGSEINGRDGGSGGGVGFLGIKGNGTLGQGFDGGSVWIDYGPGVAVSGGGGASENGHSPASTTGGKGGNGTGYSISGSAVYYGGGGGGGTGSLVSGGIIGDGGLGGGGGTTDADNGDDNTGGGGGGCYQTTLAAGNGGSGIVIIRYKFQ